MCSSKALIDQGYKTVHLHDFIIQWKNLLRRAETRQQQKQRQQHICMYVCMSNVIRMYFKRITNVSHICVKPILLKEI